MRIHYGRRKLEVDKWIRPTLNSKLLVQFVVFQGDLLFFMISVLARIWSFKHSYLIIHVITEIYELLLRRRSGTSSVLSLIIVPCVCGLEYFNSILLVLEHFLQHFDDMGIFAVVS